MPCCGVCLRAGKQDLRVVLPLLSMWAYAVLYLKQGSDSTVHLS